MPRTLKKNLTKELEKFDHKKGETFTSFDIIRIACLNLQREELRAVILFFMIGVPLILAVEQLEWILLPLRIPRTLVGLIERVLRHFIGEKLLAILMSFGLRLKGNDIAVITRIIIRLQHMFPR